MARTKKGEKAALELTPEEKLSRALVPAQERLYEIPENWVWTRLSFCIIPCKDKTEDFTDKDVKYVGLEDIDKNGGGITSYGTAIDVKSQKSIFKVGQILYGKLRPYLNKHGIATFSGVCSTDILVFESREIANSRYVNYLFDLNYYIEYAASNSKGINLPRVSEKIVLDAPVPLPPLAEQTRIVSLIETLFSQLDEARAKAQAVVDGFEDRKAAILHRAFTGELTAKWREENGVGLDSWEEKALRNVLDVRDGTHDSPVFYKEGYPLVTSKNLKNGVITTTGIKYISEADYHRINERSKVDIGDVLFAMIGTIGNPVVIETEPNYAIKNVALFKNVGRINPYYLRYYLDSKEVIDKMTLESKGSTQRFVSLGYLRVFPILTPSKEEQKEIVDVLDIVLAEEVQVKETAEQVISQIDVIKKSILARAFRGELGTNDPTDESAMELLKRVLE